GGYLSHRACSRTAQEQVAPCERSQHVIDIWLKFCRSARRKVSRLRLIIIALARLMDDVNAGNRRAKTRQRSDYGLINGMRSLAAAEYQQGRPVLPRSPIGNLKKCAAHRNSGHHVSPEISSCSFEVNRRG